GAPYFGYLRVRTGGRIREVLLGRRALMLGEYALVDWERSPLGEVFFTHHEGDEYEIDVDRRSLHGEILTRELVAFAGDELVEIETEETVLRHGAQGWSVEPLALPSLVPRRDRITTMGDPVTLDATQRGAVELARGRSLLVLGEAGFGKTTVALYRLAHLRREATARGEGFAALVIVPTEALRRLSALMLTRLGVEGIEVATFDQWVVPQAFATFRDLPKRLSTGTAPVVSRLKRHPALRNVLPEIVAGTAAMKAIERGDAERYGSREPLLHLFGDRDLIGRVVDDSAGALPRSAVATVAAHTRLQFTPTTEHAHAHVAADRLVTLDGKAIDEGTPMQNATTIDAEDCAVLFELQHLREPSKRRGRYDHLVIDEAQELAPIELAVLGRTVVHGGAVTIAGDEQQQIDEPMPFAGWPAVMAELGVASHQRTVLTESYRCPPAVESLARAIVGRPQGASRAAPDEAPIVWHRCASACHFASHVIEALNRLRERDRRSRIALVCRHYESAQRLYAQLTRASSVRLALEGDFDFRPGAIVTCVEEVRGLEFDHVIIPDASSGAYPEDPAARRAMYVAITRTMHQLWLVTTGPWSPLLRPHVPS
ncbi:MAG: AAA family ATPase, partial [Deltaproteobacteria bacterium]|nr:AAA family ATPase [Nannocystaceae bacterium]